MSPGTKKERKRDRSKRWLKHVFHYEENDNASPDTASLNSVAGPSSVQSEKSIDHGTQESSGFGLPVPESTPPDASQKTLWQRAVEEVQEDDDFARYQEAVEPSQGSNVLSPEYLSRTQKTAKKLLDDLPDSYLTFKFGHGDKSKFVVREQVRKVVKVVLACKDVIGQAISAEPHASLIWAGVLVVLPMLENIFQQDEDAASGFGQLSSELVRLQAIEEALFSPNNFDKSKPRYADLAADLEKNMVEVYVAIYRYQIQIVLHYVQKKIRRTIDNLTSTDWKKETQNAETKIGSVNQKANVLFGSRIIEATTHLKERMDKLTELQETTLDHVLESEQSRLFSELPCVGEAVFNSEANKQQRTCLEGTQLKILSKIQEWTEDPKGKLVFWLHGLAGTGKSSISQTVATCLDNGLAIDSKHALPCGTYLGASFFLNQGDSKRNHLLDFFPTIAILLAQQNPALKKHVASVIQDDKTITKKFLSEQMDKLIIKPLVELEGELPSPIRLVVVIDALDECNDKASTKEMLQLLPKLEILQQVQIRVFITSRPLDHIWDAMPNAVVESMTLEKIPQNKPEDIKADDITLLITSEMERIASDPHLDTTAGWISQKKIQDLAAKSDGLFIYAATICRFLSADISLKVRKNRMDLLLKGAAKSSNSPDAKLSEIYLRVLSFPFTELEEDERKEKYAAVTNILGFIALVFRPVSLTALASLLEQDQESVKGDLEEMYSIVSIPSDDSGSIEFFHLSFRDYLLDEKRSAPNFWVDEKATHRLLFDACLRVMETELHQDMCKLRLPGSLVAEISPETIQKRISPQLQYSSLYWVKHLAKLDEAQRIEVGLADNGRVHTFLLSKLLFWLETLGVMGMMSDSILNIKALLNLASSKETPELFCLLGDAGRFARTFRQIIEKAPLQTYISALVFSPTSSIVRNTYQHLIPKWIVRASNLEEEWSPKLYALEGHTDRIDSIAVSPDNSTIASAAEDNTIRLWNLETGAEILRIDEEVSSLSVSFLPDGKTIVYTLKNGQMRLRNIHNGKTTTLGSHRGQFYSTAFVFCHLYASPSGNNPKSRSKTLNIWNAEYETYLETVEAKQDISEAYISIGSGFLALGYNVFVPGLSDRGGGEIVLWDLEDQKVVQKLERSSAVSCIALSKCGALLVVPTYGEFEVFDVETCALQRRKNVGSCIRSLAISPTASPLLAVGTEDGFIAIYNLSEDSSPIKQFRAAGEDIPITALRFCTDELLISATETDDGIIQVWDMATPFESTADTITGVWKFSDAGSNLLIWRGNNLQVWDMKTDTSRPLIRDTWDISELDSAISPDGHIIALISDYNATVPYVNRSIEFWDESMTLRKMFDDVWTFKFSGDGQMVALENGSTLRLLNIRTWDVEAEIKSHWITLRSSALMDNWTHRSSEFSADNRHLAWMSEVDSQCHIQVRDLKTEETVIDVSSERSSRFSMSLDGGLLAFCPEESNNQHVVETRTGKTKFIIKADYVQFDDEAKHVFCLSKRSHEMVIADITSGNTIHTIYLDEAFRFPQFDTIGMARTGEVMRYTQTRASVFIQMWDAKFEEIGKYEADAAPVDLHFSEDETHLVGSIGRFPLWSLATCRPCRPARGLPKEARNCMYASRQWIVQGFGNLLWLPPDYRVESSRIVVTDATVAIGLPSGKLTILELDLEQTPFATGWDEDEDLV